MDWTDRSFLLGFGTLIAATLLFVSPWLFGFVGVPTAAWSAWILAVLMLISGEQHAVARTIWAGWALLIIGLWTLLAPVLLGFAAIVPAFLTHVAAGLLAIIAGWPRMPRTGMGDMRMSR
jgi:hypothetical protein